MSELALQSDLGIQSVTDLQEALMAHLESEGPLALVGDQVQRVHTAGLQLLHAFVLERAARGSATTITSASPALVAAARQLALAVSLGVDSPSSEEVSGEHA